MILFCNNKKYSSSQKNEKLIFNHFFMKYVDHFKHLMNKKYMSKFNILPLDCIKEINKHADIESIKSLRLCNMKLYNLNDSIIFKIDENNADKILVHKYYRYKYNIYINSLAFNFSKNLYKLNINKLMLSYYSEEIQWNFQHINYCNNLMNTLHDLNINVNKIYSYHPPTLVPKSTKHVYVHEFNLTEEDYYGILYINDNYVNYIQNKTYYITYPYIEEIRVCDIPFEQFSEWVNVLSFEKCLNLKKITIMNNYHRSNQNIILSPSIKELIIDPEMMTNGEICKFFNIKKFRHIKIKKHIVCEDYVQDILSDDHVGPCNVCGYNIIGERNILYIYF